MTKRILITPRSLTQRHSPDLQALENAGYELVYARPGVTPTEQELLELVPGCVGWLAGVEPISERVLRAATNLKVISRNGTGVDNIPVTLHCPPLPAGRPLINRKALGSLKDGSCLVNTARGSLVDENAVATKDQTIQPDLERFVAKRMGATTFETDSSHVPMLSQPEFVLDVIRKAATAVMEKTES